MSWVLNWHNWVSDIWNFLPPYVFVYGNPQSKKWVRVVSITAAVCVGEGEELVQHIGPTTNIPLTEESMASPQFNVPICWPCAPQIFGSIRAHETRHSCLPTLSLHCSISGREPLPWKAAAFLLTDSVLYKWHMNAFQAPGNVAVVIWYLWMSWVQVRPRLHDCH